MLITSSIHPNDLCFKCGRHREYGEHYTSTVFGYICSGCWLKRTLEDLLQLDGEREKLNEFIWK